MIRCLILLALLTAGFGCKQDSSPPGPKYSPSPPSSPTGTVYHFAVHPLHNPRKLAQAYQPLIDYLNAKLPGSRFTLEASRDYANFEEKYRGRHPEFILPNPWQTLQAIKMGYVVIAMAGEPQDFKGIFIVRKDSAIKEPADLKSKAVSYPSPTALAACIMPQYFLHTHGININKEIDNRYVGSQESSIMNVFLKITVAGATWPPPWRAFQKDHPLEASELKIVWETAPLINNSVMVRNDVPATIGEQVQRHLGELHKSEPGRWILGGMETARFIPASNQEYEVVRAYVAQFEQEVRKVENK